MHLSRTRLVRGHSFNCCANSRCCTQTRSRSALASLVSGMCICGLLCADRCMQHARLLLRVLGVVIINMYALDRSSLPISLRYLLYYSTSGYPNVGKSSVINTLVKKKSCKVAPVPGETKVWQYITLMKRIYLIDCPGVVYPSSDGEVELVLKGVVRAEKLSDPAVRDCITCCTCPSRCEHYGPLVVALYVFKPLSDRLSRSFHWQSCGNILARYRPPPSVLSYDFMFPRDHFQDCLRPLDPRAHVLLIVCSAVLR